MLRTFYIGVRGALAAQTGLDITANNISNVSTTGFKAQKPSFYTLVYTAQHADGGALAGSGTQTRAVENPSEQGMLQQTGRALDFALTDDNIYFCVETQEGPAYTRCGRFYLSEENGQAYLVTDAGQYALNAAGQRIAYSPDETPALGMFRFENEGALLRRPGMLFYPTQASGAAMPAQDSFRSGWLEGSNVDLTEEMAHLIQMQKSFAMSAKMIQISDEISQTVNMLRG